MAVVVLVLITSKINRNGAFSLKRSFSLYLAINQNSLFSVPLATESPR